MIPCDFDEIIEKSSRITLSNENFFTQLSTHKALSNITKFLRYQKRGIETNRSYNTSTLVNKIDYGLKHKKYFNLLNCPNTIYAVFRETSE